MVRPPVVKALPDESRVVRVTVTEDPEATVEGLPVMATVDRASEAGPGVTVTVGRVDVTEAPPIVAEIVVAVPAVVPTKLAA
jgi:hypothetical protein